LRQLTYQIVKWPAKGVFRISRSALSEFITVQVSISDKDQTGRAECRPYARYSETAETVIDQIEGVKSDICSGCNLEDLQSLLPSGAARNALDCALWDLKAKLANKPVWQMAGLSKPRPRETAYTLSMDTSVKMAEAAKAATEHNILKLKIGAADGLKAVQAVLKARPDARLIVDANEALTTPALAALSKLELSENIALIEQPFPAQSDRPRLFDPHQNPIICADESLHTSDNLQDIWDAGYRAINVKLDKTGGLTEAIKVMHQAQAMGFKIMAGCMVGSSLAMAPMMMLESFADYIDLDGPLLLSEDIESPLKYKGGKVFPPSKDLWG